MTDLKFGGWRLAVYQWEYERYPAFYEVKFDRRRAAVLLKKFSRHFKTSCPLMSSIRKRGGGHYTASLWGGHAFIALPDNPSLALVCHEYAHHLATTRNKARCGHGKEFKRELKRVYTFAKRYLPK